MNGGMIGSGGHGVKTDFSKSAGDVARGVRKTVETNKPLFARARQVGASGARVTDRRVAAVAGNKVGRAQGAIARRRGVLGLAAGSAATGAVAAHEVSKGLASDELRKAVQHGHRAARLVRQNRSAARLVKKPGPSRVTHRLDMAGAFALGTGAGSQLQDAASRRANGDGGDDVSKGLLAAVSKGGLLPATPHSSTQLQPRDPFGRWASHTNDYKLVHIDPAGSRTGKLVEAHGVSGLAPAHVSRPRTRPASSMSPNGAGHGRRLT